MVRRLLRLVLRPALLLLSLLWVPWIVAWAVNLDAVHWRIPAALAFLPYAAVATLLVLLLDLALRARVAAALALLGLVLLVVPRIGRATSDPQPRATGPIITIATSNVLVGEGSTTALTTLLRREHVDLLAVEENTPDWDDQAEQAGLRDLLPEGFSAARARPGAAGLALLSRWPTTPVAHRANDRRSIGATIAIPGAAPIQVRAAHPPPPFNATNMDCWRHCIPALATTTAASPNAIIAGDFNATLDEHPLRQLLARGGFRDAAAQAGEAWRPTWSNGRWATLSIDHVLVTSKIAVLGVTVHDLPGSDHDVVVARLRLPRAS